MKPLSHRFLLLGLCLPASLFTMGCNGPPRCTATGKILLNGNVLPGPTGPTPPGSTSVQVRIVPDMDSSDPSKLVDPLICLYDMKTGQFKTIGNDGKGVDPGKYHVVVQKDDDAELTAKFSKGRTPIVVEVKAPNVVEPAVIDLSKY